ncbi:hypothetical protein M422DRAFT_245318 [Sphaerobolus stellatus SS14]|nr:hypothetical protein M422DRAFT_245318 [Sphaerobolus stellatus SS14]
MAQTTLLQVLYHAFLLLSREPSLSTISVVNYDSGPDAFNFDSLVEDTTTPCPAIINTVVDKHYLQSFDSSQAQIWPFTGSFLASPSFATEYEVDESRDDAPGLVSMLESQHDESSSSMSQGHYSTSRDLAPFTATLTTTAHFFKAPADEVIDWVSIPPIPPQIHAQDRRSTAGYNTHCRHAILPLNPLDTEGMGRYIDKLMSDEGLLFKCRTKRCRAPVFYNELKARGHVCGHFANKRFRCLW